MEAMCKKETKSLKADYLYGLKMVASFGIVGIYCLIFALVSIIFPGWIVLNVLPHSNHIVYIMFVVMPIALALAVFMGYNWWWLCKNIIQHRLGSWLLVEL